MKPTNRSRPGRNGFIRVKIRLFSFLGNIRPSGDGHAFQSRRRQIREIKELGRLRTCCANSLLGENEELTYNTRRAITRPFTDRERSGYS